MAKTVVGLFDTFGEAQSVVTELHAAGIPSSDISLVANQAARDEFEAMGNTTTTTGAKGADAGARALTGAGVGAAVGGVTGLLVGLGALAIPGIGPIVAAGPLAATLAGAGIGAAAGGMIGALTAIGVPEEEAHHYAEGVRRGGTLVSVRVEDNLLDRAVDVMHRHNAVDVKQRAAIWSQSGYRGHDPKAKPYTRDDIMRERQLYASTAATPPAQVPAAAARTTTRQTEGAVAMPIVEEQLAVGKREVQRGGVRVYSHVIEKPVQATVNLREEHVKVERRPVDRAATGADWDSFREGTVEITERAEEAVVAKQARVVEEVIVGKEVTQHQQTVRDTVRRTDVQVEQVGAGTATRARDFSAYDADLRSHHQTTYGRTGQAYEAYQPAYRYGYDMANDPRYANRDWDAVESDFRTDWTKRNPNSKWEQAKDAARFAWEKARGRR